MASKRTYNESVNVDEENKEMPLTPRTVALPRKRVNTNSSQSRCPLITQNFVGSEDENINQLKQNDGILGESYGEDLLGDSSLTNNDNMRREVSSENKINESECSKTIFDIEDDTSIKDDLFCTGNNFVGTLIKETSESDLTVEIDNSRLKENDVSLNSINYLDVNNSFGNQKNDSSELSNNLNEQKNIGSTIICNEVTSSEINSSSMDHNTSEISTTYASIEIVNKCVTHVIEESASFKNSSQVTFTTDSLCHQNSYDKLHEISKIDRMCSNVFLSMDISTESSDEPLFATSHNNIFSDKDESFSGEINSSLLLSSRRHCGSIDQASTQESKINDANLSNEDCFNDNNVSEVNTSKDNGCNLLVEGSRPNLKNAVVNHDVNSGLNYSHVSCALLSTSTKSNENICNYDSTSLLSDSYTPNASIVNVVGNVSHDVVFGEIDYNGAKSLQMNELSNNTSLELLNNALTSNVSIDNSMGNIVNGMHEDDIVELEMVSSNAVVFNEIPNKVVSVENVTEDVLTTSSKTVNSPILKTSDNNLSLPEDISSNMTLPLLFGENTICTSNNCTDQSSDLSFFNRSASGDNSEGNNLEFSTSSRLNLVNTSDVNCSLNLKESNSALPNDRVKDTSTIFSTKVNLDDESLNSSLNLPKDSGVISYSKTTLENETMSDLCVSNLSDNSILITASNIIVNNIPSECDSLFSPSATELSKYVSKSCDPFVPKENLSTKGELPGLLENDLKFDDVSSHSFTDKDVLDTLEDLKHKVLTSIDNDEPVNSEIPLSTSYQNFNESDVFMPANEEENYVFETISQSIVNDVKSISTDDKGSVMDTVNESIYDLKEVCNDKDEEIRTLVNKIDSLMQELERNKMKYSEIAIENGNKFDELYNQLEEEKKKQVDNYSLFIISKNERDQAIEKMENNEAMFSIEKEEYKAEISELKNTIENLRKSLSDRNDQIINLEEANSDYNKISVELEMKIDTIMAERDFLKVELDKNAIDLSDAQNQLSSLNDIIQKYRGELINQEKSIKDINISFENCQAELSENKNNILKKDEIINDLEGSIVDLKKEKEDLLLTVERLTSEEEKILAQNNKLNDLNNQLSKNILSFESQLRNMNQKTEEGKTEQKILIDELGKNIVNSINGSIESSKSLINESLKETFSEIIDRLKNDYHKLSQKIDTITKSKNAQIEDATKLNTQLMSSLKELQNEISQEKIKINSVLNEMRVQFTSLNEAFNDFCHNEELSNLVQIVPSIREVVCKLSVIEGNNFVESEFKQKIELLENENAGISKTCEKLRKRCNRLESSVDDADAKERTLTDELISLKIKNMEYEVKLGLITPEDAAHKCCHPDYPVEYFQKFINTLKE